MKLLILLCTISLVRTTPVPETCNGVKIINSNILLERKVIKTGVKEPSDFAMDLNSNILYFNYGIPTTTSTGLEDSYMTATIDLKDNKLKNIKSVTNAFTQAIDKTKNEVYIGSNNGIYKYDPKSNTAELYTAIGKNIWSLFFHDDLYYTEYPSVLMYVVKNGLAIRLRDVYHTIVGNFVIDKDDDMFYNNETGVYGQKKNTKDAKLYQVPNGSLIRCLTPDNNGIIYACVLDGIYVVNKQAQRFDKIVEIDDPYSIAFDRNNNLIYSDIDGIYILKPNKDLIC